MKEYPFRSRAICLSAPAPKDVDKLCAFIGDVFVKDKIDTLVLLTRYAYQFESHPECRGDDAMSLADVKKILAACRANGIKLIPKMNLLGHQSGVGGKPLDGLLRGHPEFDETPEKEVEYCRSLCPTHPGVLPIVLDLVDEMADAFECDAFHIGCDEVFEIGTCPRCRSKSTAQIFSDWVNAISDHLISRGITPMMWGDRLLNGMETGYGHWEASVNGTDPAIHTVNRGIVLCDWHYEDWPAFPSVELFAKKGFMQYVCTSYKNGPNAKKFIDAAIAAKTDNILGIMATTWLDATDFIDAYEGRNTDEYPVLVVNAYRAVFE